ncbi:hypothetical protein [Iodidimonas sp. SYSU 1G8]|uniref:hypothetical protein n=1 Tax=Iodidimonas sp. SYSU 1G8 TaxID=3133967 RepID=UPI0031FED7FF
MSFIPLALPPGVFGNGTELQASGRWSSANLVRWANGAMFPVGGWLPFTDGLTGPARGAIAWVDNSGDRHLAVGTPDHLYEVNEAGTVDEITPGGLTSGSDHSGAQAGYGSQLYGEEPYGTPRSATSSITDATTWSLDTWGEHLVGCSTSDGKLYEWPLTGDAAVIADAPTGCAGLAVTAERFLFALGAGGNKRLVQWSDQEDNTSWTPSATNQAGDKELATVGAVMAARRVRGQTLILTTVDAHVAEYQGPPYVYGFRSVGSACGLIAPNACAVINGDIAIWMGDAGSFYVYDGGVARAVQSDMADLLRRTVNFDQKAKIFAVTNSDFDEVTWFYPSVNGTECDSYVSYSTTEGHWMTGTLARSAGVDKGVWPFPLYVAPSGGVFEHEVGFDYDGAVAFAESGPVQLGNGDQVMMVRQLIPDELVLGDVRASFLTRFYPTGEERTFGPYALGNPTDVRFSGRQVRMRLEGARATSWRVGAMRLEAQPTSLR